VLGGEPCVDETRIPTASIWTLRAERGLDVDQIVYLYRDLNEATVTDVAPQLRGRADP